MFVSPKLFKYNRDRLKKHMAAEQVPLNSEATYCRENCQLTKTTIKLAKLYGFLTNDISFSQARPLFRRLPSR